MLRLLTTHLWQSTFFAVAAGILTLAFRENRAQIRYWLWLSASLKFLIPFALLMSLGRHMEWAPAQRFAAGITTPAVSYTMEQFSDPPIPGSLVAASPSPGTIHWISAAILGIWLCGFLIIVLIRFRSWLRVRSAVRTSTPIDIRTAVEIRASPGLLEPGVVGLLCPVLLLPEGIMERLTPSELETILAHELCHVRRRDNLFALIHMIVESVFWFHPLVWWIGARLVEERERACDEEVLSLGNLPDVYADAILNVCKLYVESPVACVSGVSGASIRRRIEAIIANRRVLGLNRAKKFLLATAGVGALAGPIVIGLVIGVGNVPVIRAQSQAPQITQATAPAPVQLAQVQLTPPPPATQKSPAAPRPKFDVVSVRRCMPGDELTGPPGGRGGGAGRGPRFSPGRLRVQCLAVGAMIRIAYLSSDHLLNYNGPPRDVSRLRNAPTWVASDWYTVDAEADDPLANGPTGPQSEAQAVMAQMLQVVLEDRFQLKFHRDTEQVQMYSLTVAKGGLKLKPMETGGCIEHDPANPPPPKFADPGEKLLCGLIQDTGIALDGGGVSLSSLAGALSTTLDRHVVDKTGITGIFNFHLAFARGESVTGPTAVPLPVTEPTDTPSGPSVFTVLEGIGLKLELTKEPQGYIVIDHVERPSEN